MRRFQDPYRRIGLHLPRAHQRVPGRAAKGLGTQEVHQVLVDRITRFYGWPNDSPRAAPFRLVTRTELLLHSPRGSRDRAQGFRAAPNLSSWHIGRVRFFYDEIQKGRSLDPISISDAKILIEQSYRYKPILLDGHHRLAASHIAGVPSISAHFTGRQELLEYLTGQSDEAPAIE